MSKKIILASVIAALLVSMPAMAIQICNTVMDVQSGTVNTTVTGIDTSTLHNGQMGQQINLLSTGGFTGTLRVEQPGSYGILQTFVNVNSAAYGVGADLQFSDHQIFNVMSGNHTNNVEGYFYAEAAGNNGNVQMNLKSIGSMYVWSEATNAGPNPLQGNYIEKEVWTTQNGVLKTDLGLWVNTTGLATMSNSAAWGWTNGETGTSNTNYNGGTRNVSATGTGTLAQYGYGANNLTFNCNYTMPGGGTVSGGLWNFNNGISGTYSMSGN